MASRECLIFVNTTEVISNLNFIPAELITDSQEIIEGIEGNKNNWVLTHGDSKRSTLIQFV